MKKFTKIALISVMVCLGLGIGVLIGGLAFGGTWQGLRKSILNGDYSIGSSSERSSVSENKVSAKDAVVSSDVREIEVDMRSGRLYFEPSADGKFNVKVQGSDGKETTVRQHGNGIQIYNDFRNYNGSVTVYYPQDSSFHELDISMGGGEVAAEGTLKATEFDVELGAGSFHAKEIEADESSWKVGAGEIILGRLESQNMDFDCGAGSIEAGIVGKQTDFNYDIACGIGSVTIGNEDYSGMAFEKKISNGKSREIEISCGIGEVQLKFD